jgi:hypothetical protein
VSLPSRKNAKRYQHAVEILPDSVLEEFKKFDSMFLGGARPSCENSMAESSMWQSSGLFGFLTTGSGSVIGSSCLTTPK